MADDQNDSPPRPTFEVALSELEAIMHALEDGQLGLAEGLARYERGISLLKQCYELLEHAERRVELLCGVDAEGNPVTQPFEPGGEQTLEEKAATRSKRRSAATPRRKPAGNEVGGDDIDEPAGLF